jgi:membrane protein
MKPKDIFPLLKQTFNEWLDDKAMRMGAALSYYTIFSIAPLLIIVMAIAGAVFGTEAAQNRIAGEISETVGPDSARAIQDMVKHASDTGTGTLATVIGIIVLVLGATGVFGELQDSLNTVWKVAPKPGRGLWGIVHDRFLSFTMVLGIGFLLLVSLVASAALSALSAWSSGVLPGGEVLWHVVNSVVSFGLITLLFAMMYKLLPDVQMAWGDVWIGAAVTALLFTIGKYLIGLYLAQAGVASAYGAVGSLVVVLVWVYYSALVFLFGAEFTHVYADRFGSHVRPAANAVPLTPEELARQGLPRSADLERMARQHV